MIVRALSLAFAQLGQPRIVAVFAKSLAISLLLCLGLGFALGEAARWALERWMPGTDSPLTHALFVVGGVALAMMAFRAVAVPITGLFGDEVVSAVEATHYPDVAAQAVPAPLIVSARMGLASVLRVVIINLAALPVYIFLIFTAIGPLILFMVINAVLLGRDLSEMVAVRHLDPSQRKQWMRNTRIEYGLLGLIVTGLFLIPFVNLVAPLVGAAAATHMFHRRLAKETVR